jgi:hypothetical protein
VSAGSQPKDTNSLAGQLKNSNEPTDKCDDRKGSTGPHGGSCTALSGFGEQSDPGWGARGRGDSGGARRIVHQQHREHIDTATGAGLVLGE